MFAKMLEKERFENALWNVYHTIDDKSDGYTDSFVKGNSLKLSIAIWGYHGGSCWKGGGGAVLWDNESDLNVDTDLVDPVVDFINTQVYVNAERALTLKSRVTELIETNEDQEHGYYGNHMKYDVHEISFDDIWDIVQEFKREQY